MDADGKTKFGGEVELFRESAPLTLGRKGTCFENRRTFQGDRFSGVMPGSGSGFTGGGRSGIGFIEGEVDFSLG